MPNLYLIALKDSDSKTPFRRLWTEEMPCIGPITVAQAFMRQKDAQKYINKYSLKKYWEVVSVKFDPKK